MISRNVEIDAGVGARLRHPGRHTWPIGRGTNGTTATMAEHALTTPGIITGLPALLPSGANPFTGGDIILGGGGSDIIQGRTGNDVIDGDALLDVQLDRDGNAGTANSNTLAAIQAGLTLNELGTMQIRRTIDATVRPGTDTAQFADVTFVLSGTNSFPVGTVNLSTSTPVEGQGIAAVQAFSDIDGIPGPVGQQLRAAPGTIADIDGIAGVTFSYQWQAGDGTTWANIGTGPTLTPIALHAGSQLRVIASFTDNHGTVESRISAATAAVPGVAPAVLTPVLTTITGGGLAFAPPAAPAVTATTLVLTKFKVALAAKPARVVVTFRLSLAATVRLEIRTPKGVLVRRISRKAGAGAVTMRWDRRNVKGRLVPLGNYKVTVVAATPDGANKSASKVVRVR